MQQQQLQLRLDHHHWIGRQRDGTGSKTITVGVLTDQTGPGASEFGTAVAGVKAGIGVAGTEGYHINYVVGDTGTSPAGALTAAQKMVEQDHVFAVIGLSALTFSASDYLTSQGIPVVGASFDGPEWLLPKSTNMFSVFGNLDYTKVTTVGRPVHEEPGRHPPRHVGVQHLAELGGGGPGRGRLGRGTGHPGALRQ